MDKMYKSDSYEAVDYAHIYETGRQRTKRAPSGDAVMDASV